MKVGIESPPGSYKDGGSQGSQGRNSFGSRPGSFQDRGSFGQRGSGGMGGGSSQNMLAPKNRDMKNSEVFSQSGSGIVGSDAEAWQQQAQLEYLFSLHQVEVDKDISLQSFLLTLSSSKDEYEYCFRRWVRMRTRFFRLTVLSAFLFAVAGVWNVVGLDMNADAAAGGVFFAIAGIHMAGAFMTPRVVAVGIRYLCVGWSVSSLLGIVIGRMIREDISTPLSVFLVLIVTAALIRTMLVDIFSFSFLCIAACIATSLAAGGDIEHVIVANTAVILGVVALTHYAYLAELRERESFLLTVRTRQQASALKKERSKVEMLLNNIFPRAIAERVTPDSDSTFSDYFPQCTVLLCDMVGFTSMSATMEPAQLVRLLNIVIGKFDKLTRRYFLEKIKTIGDAYLLAGGVPVPFAGSADAVAHFALDMLDIVREVSQREGIDLRIRIGIHTGPIHAGVIGLSKRVYDIFGPAVDQVFQLEPTSEPMRIHISQETYAAIGNGSRFSCEPRGMIDLPDGTKARTYFLHSRVVSRPSRKQLEVASTALGGGGGISNLSTAYYLMTSPPLAQVAKEETGDIEELDRNRYTLQFKDPSEEASFNNDNMSTTLHTARIWLAYYLLLTVAYAAIDAAYLSDNSDLDIILIFRFVVCVPALFIAFVLSLERFGHHKWGYISVVFFSVATAIKFILVVDGDTDVLKPSVETEDRFYVPNLYAAEFFLAVILVSLYPRILIVHSAPVVGFLVLLGIVGYIIDMDNALEAVLAYVIPLGVVSIAVLYFEELARRVRYVRHRSRLQKTLAVEDEVQLATRLILTVLPERVYESLKANPGQTFSDHHDLATICFISVCDFASICSDHDSEKNITFLNEVFSAMDDLAEDYQMEKLKTFSGTYMCATGLRHREDDPNLVESKDDILRAITFAKSMLERCNSLQLKSVGGSGINVQIGLHAGPIVAGVIGETKFGFDVWGDSVNMASRMMSTGLPNKIQVSPTIYQAIRDTHACVPRPDILVKGKGVMTLYMVDTGSTPV